MSRSNHRIRQQKAFSRTPRALPTGILLLLVTVIIYGSVVALVSLRLRDAIRQGMIERDADVLQPIMALAFEDALRDLPGNDPAIHEATSVAVALRAARWSSVIAVRFFDAEGELVDAVPFEFLKGEISDEDWEHLMSGDPVSRFYDATALNAFIHDPAGEGDAERYALLDLRIPVHFLPSGKFIGVAQFLLDGGTLRMELKELDAHLLRQGSVAVGSGSLILLVIGLWIFWRLDRSQKLLAERSRTLQEANRLLSLRARTAAIGAVTAHVMHDIKNSVIGLRAYMSDQGTGFGEDAAAIAQTAQRMQNTIQEVLSFLREQERGEIYELSLNEICEMLERRVSSAARERRSKIVFSEIPSLNLANRDGNLLILILENLVNNALEVTPANEKVRVDFSRAPGRLEIRVRDAGPGLPPERQAEPFHARGSGKTGGTGLGLLLSRELAGHLDARLELERSDASGTTFCITLKLPDSP